MCEAVRLESLRLNDRFDLHGLRPQRFGAERFGVVLHLAQAGLQISLTPKAFVGAQTLQDKVFVITGTLPTWSREQAAAVIKKHGGKVTGSVSGKTDYLLAGERAGAKLTKAEKLGVPTLTEQALRELLGLPAASGLLG